MTTIWRVEDSTGRGPYTKGVSCITPFCTDKHPTPHTDSGIGRQPSGEICGFKDKQQAEEWFTKDDLRMLAEHGFDLKEIPVKEITAIGQKQVLAVRLDNVEYRNEILALWEG